MAESTEPIVVQKNRKRAFWSLLIVIFFIPLSVWLVYLGLQPGRPDVSWALVLFGLLGVLGFGGSAARIIRTMRASWRLEVSRADLALYTPAYNLRVPWDDIAGIVVDEVNRKPGCALLFENVGAVVQGAEFHGPPRRPDAVTDAATMQARMEDNLRNCGYHLGIPGRILELGPEKLAELLTRARTGELWQGKEGG